MDNNPPKLGLPFWHFINEYDSGITRHTNLQYVLDAISKACQKIHTDVNRAGLTQIHGKTGNENVQGEDVMKLDILSNDYLIEQLKDCKYCAGIASEENEDVLIFDHKTPQLSQYMVLFDPLDGSSNIDTLAPIGTIFAIIQKSVADAEVTSKDFLQSGKNIVASGYVLYGSSTVLVYSAGNGVHEFTFENKSQDFRLSRYGIQTPDYNNQFSINYGQSLSFEPSVRAFIDWCMEEDASTQRPFGLRYIGSMVADFHRILIKGGIFIYPTTKSAPQGKLRLLYECNPLSFIIEHAGGSSTDNDTSILEIKPIKLHQRTPITLGSKKLVDKYKEFLGK